MSRVNITIDGKPVTCEEGEFILNAARANDIFIPAICYLTRCSPTLACRICLVEANGKQVYACNTKAKEGMQITTTTPSIQDERRAIMEVYDVNHPLQCGVCDQSGECELQNYTLELGVDSQSYTIRDTKRPIKDWGHLHYDPGLCIVCERCVTVCKDMIGDNSLKTVPRGGDALDKSYKESMPKDAYAMWNKLNKSVIGLTSGEEMLDCTSCGECAAVCPVGALVDTDFIYTANAWEVKKVPATCAHCSAGCFLNYETKHESIQNAEEKIYRTSSEWNFASLCGAGRYGYDFENRGVVKDDHAFAAAVDAFKKADTIRFTSMITNEEAMILQRLKETFNYRLINEDARIYKRFLEHFTSITHHPLYQGSNQQMHDANFVISVGTALKSDNPVARYAFNNAVKTNKGAGLYFHPLADPVVEGFGKNVMTIQHAPLREEAVMYLILDLFGDKNSMNKTLADYLETFHITEKVTTQEGEEEKTVNRLWGLVGAPEGHEAFMEKNLKKKDRFALVIGPDLYAHPKFEELARLAGIIEKYTPFSVVILPPQTNTLGVGLICDLDEEAGKYVVGYNAPGDFTLSALGKGDLDMPAMNQQEGTFTSMNKQVVPTNAALPYGGFELNDIACALGINEALTVDYTKTLPLEKGFKAISFDELSNHFDNDGADRRGYVLDNKVIKMRRNEKMEPIDEALKLEGTLVYQVNPVRQFNAFTQKPHQLNEKSGLYLSPEQMKTLGVEEGQMVSVKTDSGEMTMPVVEDNKIGGAVMCVPTFDPTLAAQTLFDGYRFAVASIQKEGK